MTAASATSEPVQRVLERLNARDFKVHASGNGWEARCPAHEDDRPSLSISQGDDGRVLLRCHRGCAFDEVVRALELQPADLFPPKRPKPAGKGRIVATYPYVDERGQLLFEVVRFEPKDFRQRRPDGAGGWDWKLGDCRRVLYRLPEVLAGVMAGKAIWVVEGEKDADAFVKLGLVATTNPQGAGKWRREYTDTLRAAAKVYVVPDADAVGEQHAEAVAAALFKAGVEVRIVRLPGGGKDATDFVRNGGTADELVLLAGQAPVYGQRPPPPPEDKPANVVQLVPKKPTRPLKSRSYLSLVTILEDPELCRRVLGEKRLEYDEMGGVVTIGRKAIRDVDYSIIRTEIERQFTSGDDGGGLKFGLDDVVRAVQQVASAASYHPVREYLGGLRWDGKARWGDELLGTIGADATALNRTLLKKWAVSAVARAMSPGCKVDTVLILHGDQGIHKSSWFRAMAAPWFAAATMDLENKESFLVLQRCWVLEWSELETLSKARSQATLKAFLSKEEDLYVPKYGREAITVKRSSVIVGTTNDPIFLSDETGNRRYWPVHVTGLDLRYVEANRDQLWAEAVAEWRKYQNPVETPCHWWLTPAENAELESLQNEAHREIDPWEEAIKAHVQGRDGVRMEKLLTETLNIPLERQDQRAQKRAGKILRLLGWRRSKYDGEWWWVPEERGARGATGQEKLL